MDQLKFRKEQREDRINLNLYSIKYYQETMLKREVPNSSKRYLRK
jgi:hypothetical protein